MTHDRLPNERDVNRNADSRVHRRALIAGALATVTALGIGGVVGKDIFKGEQGVTAHDNGNDKESIETHTRPVDDLIKVKYGDFVANGDPSLFIDVDYALTVQINSLPGDSTGEKGDTDIQFVVAQLPEGVEPSDETTFSNAFVYDDDGIPSATQTVDQLTDDNGGRFNVTVPISNVTGPQHVYIVPMQVGEAMDPSELITDNHVDVSFSFDDAGGINLSGMTSRG